MVIPRMCNAVRAIEANGRAIQRYFLFVAIGMATAIAQGYAFATFGTVTKWEPLQGAKWTSGVPQHWPAVPSDGERGRGMGVTIKTVLAIPDPIAYREPEGCPWLLVNDGRELVYQSEDTFYFGWPLPILVGHWQRESGQPGASGALPSAAVGRYGFGRSGGEYYLGYSRFIPNRICFVNFAIASTAIATVLCGLRFAVCWGRRRTRHRQQRCMQCGYSLRGLLGGTAACPECGKHI